MSNVPVDVNATFNIRGKIKPMYIRIEDEEHALHTYRIERIEYDREERFAGTTALLFCCHIRVNDYLQMIKIKYYVNTHQWVLVSEDMPAKV